MIHLSPLAPELPLPCGNSQDCATGWAELGLDQASLHLCLRMLCLVIAAAFRSCGQLVFAFLLESGGLRASPPSQVSLSSPGRGKEPLQQVKPGTVKVFVFCKYKDSKLIISNYH